MKPRLAAVATTALALPLLPLLALVAPVPPAAAGPVASGEYRVNTTTTNGQFTPVVASDPDGASVVVWVSDLQDGSGYGVYLQRFDTSGDAIGAETRVNTTTAGTQQWPDVAMDADGDFVVVWESAGQDGSGSGVYVQRYDASGATVGVETRVNSTVTDNQDDANVAMNAGGAFVVTWTSNGQDGDGSGIYFQRFDAAGSPQGPETRANATTTNDQGQPSVAIDVAGRFVVTWTSVDSSAYGIFSRRFDANGTALNGVDAPINTKTSGSQAHSEVALATDGSYVVTWDDDNVAISPSLTDSSGSAVHAQRFSSSGSLLGAETLVNTSTQWSQIAPRVAMDALGNYVITWAGQRDIGFTEYDTFLQRFAADGSPIGGETRANLTVADDQHWSAVSMDADGDVVVAWQSLGQDGSSAGIYARRFRSASAAVDLRLSQVEDADPAPVLGNVSYRTRVTNLEEPAGGTTGVPAVDDAIGAATGVYVVSTIPEDASYVASTGAGWTCAAFATVVRCRLGGVLRPGDTSPRLSITYSMPHAAGTVQHSERVYENQRDPVASNNGDIENTAVECYLEFVDRGAPTPESGAVTVTVSRQGAGCGQSSVRYETVGGDARPGEDYTPVSGSLVFQEGDADMTFDVPVLADALDETDERFGLRLSDPHGALLGLGDTINATITDDDAPPRINFTTTTGNGAEPGALVDVTVRLSSVSGRPVTVTLARAGTATSGADYIAPTQVTIPAGQRSADFTIEVRDDATHEAAETAVLTLSAPVNVTLGSLKTYRLTITSNE